MGTSRETLRWAAAGALLVVLATLGPGSVRAAEGMFEPRFREGKPGDVLVKGEPGLVRGNLDAFIDLTETSLDLAWAEKGEQDLRDALETAFGAWKEAERRAFLDLVSPAAALREKGKGGDTDALKAGKRAFVIALDQRISAAPREKANRLVTEAIERSQRAVWRGIPAIKGSAADAWLEAAVFAVGLGRNEKFVPTDGQRTTVAEELDLALHPQPEPVRERLRLFHRTWLLVKARWDLAPEPRRFAIRWEAVRLLARLLPPDKALTVVQGPELSDYAREAARVAAKTGAFDAWSNVARQPEALLEALKKGLDLPDTTPDQTLLFR
jgi:hypothetical protein